jgi:hypothetical protein
MTAQPKEKWSCSLINDFYICCIWSLTHHPRLSHFMMDPQFPSTSPSTLFFLPPGAVPALPHFLPQRNLDLWKTYYAYSRSNDDG